MTPIQSCIVLQERCHNLEHHYRGVIYDQIMYCGKIGFLPDGQMHVIANGTVPIYVEP
jgi:hypothetical protein